MIKLPSELDEIREKRQYHEELQEIYQNQILCIRENIDSAESHAKLTSTPLGVGYWNLREQILHIREKQKAQLKVIKVWEDRITLWEQQFEKNAQNANVHLTSLIENCKKLSIFFPSFLVAIKNVNDHDLSDQPTKVQVYQMLLEEFVAKMRIMATEKQIGGASVPFRHAVVSILNDNKLKESQDKYLKIVKEVFPLIKFNS